MGLHWHQVSHLEEGQGETDSGRERQTEGGRHEENIQVEEGKMGDRGVKKRD